MSGCESIPNMPEKRSSLRTQQREFTRARFIDAGLEVFAEVGFHNATIDMITERAGANRSTFYLHFKDKTNLMLAAHERIGPERKASVRMINAMEDPDFEEFRAWTGRLAQDWERDRRLYEAIMQAQLTEPSITRKNYEVVCEELSGYLSRFKDEQRDDAERRVMMFLMQFEMYFYITICESAEKPPPKALDTLAELGLYALFNKTR